MRCHICNSLLDTIVFDKRDGSVMPCPDCLEAVSVAEFERDLEELEQEDGLPELYESDGNPGSPGEEGPDEGLGVGDGVPKRSIGETIQ